MESVECECVCVCVCVCVCRIRVQAMHAQEDLWSNVPVIQPHKIEIDFYFPKIDCWNTEEELAADCLPIGYNSIEICLKPSWG